MARPWIFTREQMDSTPSRLAGIDADRELLYRQQAATLVQDMGQRLNVPQLVINTAIVYMHRFFMFHSFKDVHKHLLAQSAIFLAAKVEDQPRKLEHVIRVAQACLAPREAPLNPKHLVYLQKAQDLIMLETMLLQTLGFDVTVVHPHTHVVKCSQLVRASKDLAHTSYFMATNSLHLTTLCLRYPPSVVACVCIHLACKWSSWEIPMSSDGQPWWAYVDTSVTLQLLDELTQQFLDIMEKSPNRMKRIRNWKIPQNQVKKCGDTPSKSPSGCDNHPAASCSKQQPCGAGTAASSAIGTTAEGCHQTQRALLCVHGGQDSKTRDVFVIDDAAAAAAASRATPLSTQPASYFPTAGGQGGASFFTSGGGLVNLVGVSESGVPPAFALARYVAPRLGVVPNVTLGQQPLPSSCTLVLDPPTPNAPTDNYPVSFRGSHPEPNRAFVRNVPNPDVNLHPGALAPSFVSTSVHTQDANPNYAHHTSIVAACDLGGPVSTQYTADPGAGPLFLAARGTRDFADASSLPAPDLRPCSFGTLKPYHTVQSMMHNATRCGPSRDQSRAEACSLPNATSDTTAPSHRTAPPMVRDERRGGRGAQSGVADAADVATRSGKSRRNGEVREVRDETRSERGVEMQRRHLARSGAGDGGGDGENEVISWATEAPNNSQASFSCLQMLPAPYVASDQMHQQCPPHYRLHRDPKTQFTKTQNIRGVQAAAGGGPYNAPQQHHSLAQISTSTPSARPGMASQVHPAQVGTASSANKKKAPKRKLTWCATQESNGRGPLAKPEVEPSKRILPSSEAVPHLKPPLNVRAGGLSPDGPSRADDDDAAGSGSSERVLLRDARPGGAEVEELVERNEKGGSAGDDAASAPRHSVQ
ncbi:uncharacterized protein LOC116948649 [Petromyzon marinus]|uniref:uncharacterized protein LOC116948649 n=1 Tax=Petromyzon marinus TaxID=7757 RepID=UPI003F6EDE08